MNTNEEVEVLINLVNELPVDWTGTGDPRSGEKESNDWQKRWERAIENIKAGYSSKKVGVETLLNALDEIVNGGLWKRDSPYGECISIARNALTEYSKIQLNESPTPPANEVEQIHQLYLNMNDCPFKTHLAKWFELAPANEGDAVDDWINVKDDLPTLREKFEFTEDVITYEEESGVIDIQAYWPKLKTWDNDSLITHWMPLPKPPITLFKEDAEKK